MLPALAITLREGLAAFLVAGVMIAVFRTLGDRRLRGATRWGIGLSLLATPIAGALFSTAEDQALWEGTLALVAAACVGAMSIYLWRRLRSGESDRDRGSRLLAAGICVVTGLLITRGGMEIALLVGTMLWQVPARELIAGAGLGTAAAIVAAWLWARFGARMERPLFRQVTAVFLSVYFLQLLVDGFHELTEAGALPASEPLHWATESFSTEGAYGQYASYVLIVAPLVRWLAAIFWSHGKASTGGVAHLGR
jgi:high-affinity iron transporter